MSSSATPRTDPLRASEIEDLAITTTVYPSEELAAAVKGRSKTKLGNSFGLSNFGVNHTTLQPGASSALLHYHATQDEFVYILQGQATLHRVYKSMDDKEGKAPETTTTVLNAGDCIGFPAGVAVAHCLRNESNDLVRILEVGDRSPHDRVEYPKNDLKAVMADDGQWKFTRKDGTPFTETDA